MEQNNELTPLFEPKSIAIIGASNTKGKFGRNLIENLVKNNYRGDIFPVNPKLKKILGYKVYSSVNKIPYQIDLAYVIIPADQCLSVVKECAEKGVKCILIAAGGFAETDKEGIQLQNEILQIVKKSGIRMVGPNTSGIISTPNGLVATFFIFGKVTRGSISYIAQTGNFATHTLKWILSSENYGVCRIIGLGNKGDIDDADVLKYLGNDSKTNVIAIYMEGIKDGRRFLQEATRVSKIKPILALKGGRTEAGAKMASSHTASIASNDLIVDFAFRQAGIIRLQSYEDLINIPKAFSFQPIPKGNRVGILAPSGAMGVLMSDSCEKRGLKVAEISKGTVNKIEKISPKWLKIGNPVDIWGPITQTGLEAAYRISIEALLADDAIDAVLPILMLVGKFNVKRLRFMSEIDNTYNKPILVTVTGDKEVYEKAKTYLERLKIPVYPPLEEAPIALSKMYEYVTLNFKNSLPT